MHESHQKTIHNIQLLVNVDQNHRPHFAALIKDNPVLDHNSFSLASP